MDDSDNRPHEFIFHELRLEKIHNNKNDGDNENDGDSEEVEVKSLKIYPMDDKLRGRDIFINLNIDEGIFSPMGIVGTLIIHEPTNINEDFQINGSEYIYMKFEDSYIKDSLTELKLCVNNISIGGDYTNPSVYGISSVPLTLIISFSSCESAFLDRADWVHSSSFADTDKFLPIANSSDEENVSESGPGLVNELAKKYFNTGSTEFSTSNKDMEIESTKNNIWLKNEQLMYPWSKETEPPSLLQLMSNLAENAVDESGSGCNFLFWQDFDGWHFKSVNKIIDEYENIPYGDAYERADIKDKGIYHIIMGVSSKDEFVERGDPKILSFMSSDEYQHYDFWQNGVYSSFYEHIKPNYSDPYFDYLPFDKSHKRNTIKYNYHSDAVKWPMIEKYAFLPDTIKTVNHTTVEVHDENNLYGYFSTPYNTQNPYHHNLTKNDKSNNVLWQTMFDQTDLSINRVKAIRKDLNITVKDQLYGMEDVKAQETKQEKWNVYRHSICCDKLEERNDEFLAVIDDAVLIQDDDRGGIYEYSWREVEIWPTENIYGYTGDVEPEILTEDDSPLSVVVIPNGRRGVAGDDIGIGAFNINELMNVKQGDNVFVGPGVNAADGDEDEGGNNYPEAFQMMPVGGYFSAGESSCPTNGDQGLEWRKHIVNMYRLPMESLKVTVPNAVNEETFEPEELYFFDVQNAHDGMCGECEEVEVPLAPPPPPNEPFGDEPPPEIPIN
jgi:hypothetical protein